MIIDPIFDIYFMTIKDLETHPNSYMAREPKLKWVRDILRRVDGIAVFNWYIEIDPSIEEYFHSFSSWSTDEHQGILETTRVYECPCCEGNLDGIGECEFCGGTGQVETTGRILRNQYGEALKEI